MPIVSILNPKGGCGKTTLSTNLARALHDRGFRVLLVDSDPQGSARDWHAASDNNPIPLVALDRPNNLKTLPGIAAGYDITIIDGAAKLEDMIAAAIKVSDTILIPVQPSPYDVWAASDLADLIKARQEITDGSPATAFVITRAIENTLLAREVHDTLNEYGFELFQARTIQRQTYPTTASSGSTVFQGGDPKAKAEIAAITDELLRFTKTQKKPEPRRAHA